MPAYPNSPELIVGLVGPIGCNIDAVEAALSADLRSVKYSVHNIRLSDTIPQLIRAKDGAENTSIQTLEAKIEAGNRVRQIYNVKSILAVEAIRQIRALRKKEHDSRSTLAVENEKLEDIPAPRTAYIIRQLKNSHEVELLSRVYGKQFIQVSITQDKQKRIEALTHRIRSEHASLDDTKCIDLARKLIATDENEEDPYGQKLSEIFHLADVFIQSSDIRDAAQKSRRFIEALFGKTDIAPTKDEFGSYMAKAASLRSVDLSRQVGAAIISCEGDIITLGCNEVPKPLGGNFWDEDLNKSRDVDKLIESNKQETSRIVSNLLENLGKANVLREGIDLRSIQDSVEFSKAISESKISDITEYGRMVHAEMNALSDAARLGRAVKDANLYVTTFPCHNCAKHIIASGISRVVFVEPYPKSRAELLYSDAIASDPNDRTKISMEHFSGISPRRYRDIFEKGKRRNSSGHALAWYEDECAPRVGYRAAGYFDAEAAAVIANLPKELVCKSSTVGSTGSKTPETSASSKSVQSLPPPSDAR